MRLVHIPCVFGTPIQGCGRQHHNQLDQENFCRPLFMSQILQLERLASYLDGNSVQLYEEGSPVELSGTYFQVNMLGWIIAFVVADHL